MSAGLILAGTLYFWGADKLGVSADAAFFVGLGITFVVFHIGCAVAERQSSMIDHLKRSKPPWIRIFAKALVASIVATAVFFAIFHRVWGMEPLWALCYSLGLAIFGVGSIAWHQYAPEIACVREDSIVSLRRELRDHWRDRRRRSPH